VFKLCSLGTFNAMALKLDLVSFFEGTKGDYRGRKLSEILAWSDDELENCHDYIQSLFPLPEESMFGRNPAVVDKALFDAFRSREELREALRNAFTRMLSLYGLKWSESSSESTVSQHIIITCRYKVITPSHADHHAEIAIDRSGR
jgi:hypothetical protein